MTHKLEANPCTCGGALELKRYGFIGCNQCDVVLLESSKIDDETVSQWNKLFPLRPSGETVEIVTTSGEPVAFARYDGSIINGYARVVAHHHAGTKLMFKDGDRCWPADVVLRAKFK